MLNKIIRKNKFLIISLVVILLFSKFYNPGLIKISFINSVTKSKIYNYQISTSCDAFEEPICNLFLKGRTVFKSNTNGNIEIPYGRFFKMHNKSICKRDSIDIIINKGKSYDFFKIHIAEIDTVFEVKNIE